MDWDCLANYFVLDSVLSYHQGLFAVEESH